MKLTKIEKPSDSPITPADVDTDQHFWGAFSAYENEVSARWLVKLAQHNGYWKPFTVNEAEDFYRSKGFHHFLFNGVYQWLIKEDGKYQYTVEFVARCYQSSPAASMLVNERANEETARLLQERAALAA